MGKREEKDRLQVLDWIEKLETVYARATIEDRRAGLTWYQIARRIACSLARVHGLTVYQTAGIISALSPQVDWNLNIALASEFMLCARNGRSLRANFPQVSGQIEKAYRLYSLDNPTESEVDAIVAPHLPDCGHKTFNFSANIAHPNARQRITIDRHIWRLLHMAGKPTDRRYRLAMQALRTCAQSHNLVPAQYQAIVWIVQRNETRTLNQINQYSNGLQSAIETF